MFYIWIWCHSWTWKLWEEANSVKSESTNCLVLRSLNELLQFTLAGDFQTQLLKGSNGVDPPYYLQIKMASPTNNQPQQLKGPILSTWLIHQLCIQQPWTNHWEYFERNNNATICKPLAVMHLTVMIITEYIRLFNLYHQYWLLIVPNGHKPSLATHRPTTNCPSCYIPIVVATSF